jgi:hypothetical protein
MGPRAGLDDVEKIKFLILPGLELGPLSRTARSQSLYRLRYPGSRNVWRRIQIMKFLIMHSSSSSNYFFPLRSKFR